MTGQTDWVPLDVSEQKRRRIQRVLELALMTPDGPSNVVRDGETRDEALESVLHKLDEADPR